MITAEAGFASGNPVTLVTEAVVALAAVASPVIAVLLARRRALQYALRNAQTDAGMKADLTLGSWTALNGALQTEITRLQGVVDKMQGRIEKLEAEIDSLETEIQALAKPGTHA